jgi:tRNA uridine 5-carboxymethylaminomethyl modification enzyme
MYVNGFSTSLPEDIQFLALRSVPGLEKVKIIRPGYAIEYDFFHPYQLLPTLETKLVENLYFAGQINGSSGYEEAAAQGLMAGINASLKLTCRSPLILGRADAYIGVLIDDLITKETNEPYRMFTSSAEHRLILRHDNADLRLRKFGYDAGLVSRSAYDACMIKQEAIHRCKALIHETKIFPSEINHLLLHHGYPELSVPVKTDTILKRPGIVLADILRSSQALCCLLEGTCHDEEVLEQCEIDIKYEGYVKRDLLMTDKMTRLEQLQIPDTFNYDLLSGLSNEGREKLKRHLPSTIGQASRILGVSPSDVSVLLVRLGR